MTAYGVVACPKCERVQGVQLAWRSATCPSGHRFSIPPLRVLFETEDPRTLPEALGRIRAERAGEREGYDAAVRTNAPRVPEPASVSAPRSLPDAPDTILDLLKSLETEGEGFPQEEAEEALDAAGLGGSRVLQTLLQAGLLVELRDGRYRVV